jgi:cell division septum initiation protein DivIVA
MTDYKEKFDKWQRETKERFEEIDKQLGLKDKLEEGAKVVAETAQKGAEVLREGAQKIKSEAEKSEVGKQAVKAAGETAKKAWEASEPIRDAAGDAGGKAADAFGKTAVEAEKTIKTAGRRAGEVIGAAGAKAATVFEDARGTFESAANGVSKAFNFGANWTRAFDSTFKTVRKTGDWIAENPAQAAVTGASMAVGAGLGAVFTGISSHWLFNSALPAWSVKKLGEQFNEYLKTQEELITKGELSKAEAERVEFERDIVKKIGAPLLGSFAFASGAVMMTNVLNPKTITGAPLDWILGGNPLLEGVWFFGNGLVCFKTGYEFFMIALEDQQEVQRMVREIKGLLPQQSEA